MKIGIAISGGGYRATSFGLGTFSYLDQIQHEGKPLLKHTIALSTVSGGSIVGLTYAQWTKAGLKFEDYFKWLFEQITTFDLVTDSIDNYVEDKSKNSLIEGFSTTYGCSFLTHRKFWSIEPFVKDGESDTHLLYYSINSTDFNTGTPFKFIAQHPSWEEYLIKNNLLTTTIDNKPTTKMRPFLVGNGFFRLNKNIELLPLNVALASSSCFPGGFEPIILRMEDHLKKSMLHEYVALMDGGIVDNQGVDAIIDFQRKIDLDFVLVVDSASPNMTKYSQSSFPDNQTSDSTSTSKADSKENEIDPIWGIGDCKISFLSTWLYIFTALFALALLVSLCFNTVFTLLFTVLTTVFIVLSVASFTVKNILNNALVEKGLKSSVLEPLSHLTPNTIKQLFVNRFNSLESLINSVFMKHIRRLNVENLFEVHKLRGKILVNTLYQNKVLEDNEKFLLMNHSQKGLFNEYSTKVKDLNKIQFEKLLKNGEINEYKELYKQKMNEILGGIPEISKNAYDMGTTLWVSKDESGKKVVRDVIVTGQISTCVNMINNQLIKKNYSHIHNKAQEDWKKFKDNPYWLIDQLLANENDVHSIFKEEQRRQHEHYVKTLERQKIELESFGKVETLLSDYKK